MIPSTSASRSRPALGLAVIGTVIVAAALAVLAVAGGDDGTAGVAGSGSPGPPAPWRAGAVARPAVPAAWSAAWDRARNRTTCALLFPLDGGPELVGATPGEARTPDDGGWDIFLTGGPGSVEVLGLFESPATPRRVPEAPAYTKTWADGSVATYSVEAGNAAPGTFDADASPFEAVLTVPGQACAYRVYDTLGKAHLESTLARLRFMAR